MRGEYRERRGAARAFTGLLLLAVGAILLAGNLNLFPVEFTLSQWWPAILIVIGIKHLIVFRGTRALVGSLFWIGTGALFLSVTLGYLSLDIPQLIWPVMLIWFGVCIFLGSTMGCGRRASNGSES